MAGTDSPRIARTELARWVRDPVVLITIAALIVLSGLLTYLAVNVATGAMASGGNGVQLQTDTALTADSTNGDLASMGRSSLTMLVPIAAIVLGVRLAGSELTSGALLQIAAAARRLRYLFIARAAILILLAGVTGATTAIVTMLATATGIAPIAELSHLTAWTHSGSTIAGATTQAVIIALIAFGLSALSRRWVIVTICMIVYLMALEPILTGLLGKASAWLPRVATSELMIPQPDLAPVLPTAICAAMVTTVAIVSLRRDCAAR